LNYTDTLRYLYEALPMFQRIDADQDPLEPGGKRAIKPGMIQDKMPIKASLDNVRILCSLLGDPQTKFKSVHLAGTNGKGSTSHMLAAIFQQSGYRTGLYTSPHLKDFRERIRVNGKMIPRSTVVRFVKEHTEDLQNIKPSFFEMTVGLAFEHFADEKVDIAVIETGLGGRLDSTNIIDPELSVITNIGYDHMNILGNRLEEIAAEKAGIIKEGKPVVVGEFMEEVAPIFEETARQRHAPLRFASLQYEAAWREEHLFYQEVFLKKPGDEAPQKYRLDLKGNYQVKNLKTVLCAVEELEKLGFSLANVHKALSRVQRLTHLTGRWTTMGRSPLIICDTGHNADGLRDVVEQIKSTRYNVLRMVIGVVNDKDIMTMLQLLPREAVYYFCQASIARALPAGVLKEQAQAFGLRGESYESSLDALNAAKADAGPKDFIFIGGSTFIVGELIRV